MQGYVTAAEYRIRADDAYKARGDDWRAEFAKAKDDGKPNYHAALIAESIHGDEFQRGVCALAIQEGRTGPNDL